jgi:protease-4
MVLVVLFLFQGVGNLNQFSSPDRDYLARISVVGEIGNASDAYSSSDQSYHHAWTLSTIDNLIGDAYNKGLLLYVNSPGGGVYESDELYLKIEEYKEKTQRPVYVYMGSMAASGGYYISAPAKTIYANRNTWTGSIGVIIGTLFDVSDFLKKYGIKATDITSGKNKGMGSNFTPMTTEQRAIYQSLVDDAYEQFVGIVADGRHMTAEQVRKIADGRIYTARQAVENGLIDKIALEKEAIALIRTELGDENMYVDDLVYKAESDIFNFSLMNAISLRSGLLQWLGVDSGQDATGSAVSRDGLNGDVAAVLNLTREEDRVPIKYLYQ